MEHTDLDGRIRAINQFSKAQLTIDHMIGQGWRIARDTPNRPGAIERYLSPRGARKQIALWLDGFEEGLRYAEEVIT